ncbi:MAG: hypothetical protein Greene101449_1329 [Candidatus Peregrinibacteria bacterium Greene1014_49]|nr:MAG: hypothetical protein Greene101449_1329 [Candidatus Peregrinibacteria bacterium Greene1014_49]
MPLRHSTETALLLILGIVIACAGLLTASLPGLPGGIFPWAVLFAITVAYPILLTPLFRARRADTPLRWMHWFPAAMLLMWFLIEVAALYVPHIAALQSVYTMVWTLPAVALGILILVLYCLKVIRRRLPRISVLLLTFIVFLVFGVASVRGNVWNKQIAATLWEGGWWQIFGTGSTFIASNGTGTSLEEIPASADSSEERWRQKLRTSERRSAREIQKRNETQSAGALSSAPQSTMAIEPSSSAPLWRSASSAPAALPSSGGAVEVLALTLIALYSGVLHDRARRRSVC